MEFVGDKKDVFEDIQMRLMEKEATEVIRIVHEVLDDTPYKTKNYYQYSIDEDSYFIEHINQRFKDDQVYKTIDLMSPKEDRIGELLKNRKSIRDYTNKELSFEDFSTLMANSFGMKDTFMGAYSLKEYPVKMTNSQGGLNYLDMYLFINNVEDVESGIYYYNFLKHQLIQLDYGNVRPIISKIHYQNEFTTYSNMLVMYIADLKRVSWKYLRRSYRFAHVDTGIAAANLQISSENLGLGTCMVAGYLEHEVEKYLQLTPEEIPILSVSIGTK